MDIRNEIEVQQAVQKTVDIFGGIDVLINNASALDITPSILNTSIRNFDLVYSVNVRATFICSQACLPYLRKATNPHILTISPPINLKNDWFDGTKSNIAYTISKYGMSLMTKGLFVEFAKDGIGVNSLWPKYVVATMAVKAKLPEVFYQAALSPKIVSDAAYIIITSDSKTNTGNFFLDEDVLREAGLRDIREYQRDVNVEPIKDFYVE